MNLLHRVLLIGDLRHHHDPQGTQIIADTLRAAGIDATMTEDPAAVATLSGGKFACAILSTQGDTFDAAQEQLLMNFVRSGGGLLGVHSATATNKTSDPYAKLLGSRFIGHGPVFDYSVKVTDPDHPIAHRIKDFRITDELYMLDVKDELQVFLGAWWKGKLQPVGYTKREGDGRVVYLANGHDPAAMSHPMVQQLLVRGVRYACGEDWSQKTVKVAAIGYGGAFNMGKLHLESCNRARLKPVAVCDVDPKRTAIAKTDFGEQMRTFNSIDDLLKSSDAEMCIVITPHNTHAPLAIRCLESGRHVVTEKPFTITIEEATQVIDAAKANKKMATVFHNRRWDGDFQAIRKVIENGEIGEVFLVECAYGGYGEQNPTWWRTDKQISGGALHDWGAHFVDWVLQLLSQKIESVSGYFRKEMWHQVTNDDHATAHIRFEGGAMADIEFSALSSITKSRFRILGTLGGIELKGWDPKEGIRVVTFRNGVRHDGVVPYMENDFDGFYRNVADHLILGEPLIVTPESARKVIAVIDLAEQSSKMRGAPLTVPFEQ